MNYSRLALAVLVCWVVSMPIGFLVNDIILGSLIHANSAAFRPDADIMANMPIGFGFMLVGYLVFAATLVHLFPAGPTVREGLMAGLVVGILLDTFVMSWWWATVPVDKTLIGAMMIDYLVEYPLYGAIVALIYRPAATTRTTA